MASDARAPQHEAATSTRDDDTTTRQYETVMRSSHAFYKRRDLAPYDEVPLYFAWERLYKAANSTLRVDWIDESYDEFLQRKHARVAPRRGLPPSLSASVERQRESARSSSFLRATTRTSTGLDDPYLRGSARMRAARATKQAMIKEKKNKIKKMSKRTRAILEKIERELRSGEYRLKSPLKANRQKRAAGDAPFDAFMKSARSSVHPLPTPTLHRRGSIDDDESGLGKSMLTSSFVSSADPARVAAFLESSLESDDPLLEFGNLSPIKRKSETIEARPQQEATPQNAATRAMGKLFRKDLDAEDEQDAHVDKTIDTTQDSSFSDDSDARPIRPQRKLSGRPVNLAYHQLAKSPRSLPHSEGGVLHTLDEENESEDDRDVHIPHDTVLHQSQPDRLRPTKTTSRKASVVVGGGRGDEYEYEEDFGVVQDAGGSEVQASDRRLSRSVGPQSRQSLSVSQQAQQQQQQQQRSDASRKASVVVGGGRGDEYEYEEDFGVVQDAGGSEVQASDRRLSRSVGPQSRQSLSVSQQAQQQQQQQQRSDASRKASVVVGGDRGDEYEYEEDFGVVQDAGGSEVQASDRRLSRSVGPQSRQSLSVSQQAQQQQQQQQRSDASRKASVVVGGGRGDEYEYEEDFGVVQDAGGSEVQASDRRLSRSVGPQSRQSLSVSQQAQQQQQQQQRSDASRKASVVVGGDRGDEYEYEEDFGVVQDAGGSEVQASDRRLSRPVGPQSRQSLSVSQQAQQQQQQQQRSDASRKASVVVGGGRGDEYEYEEDFGVVQDAGGSEVQASDRRLSRSVGPQSRQSLSVSQQAQQQQQQQQRSDASRKASVVVGGGRGDEYEYEEDFGVVQDAGGSEVQASDRRLSRSVGPQSRQSLSVSQQAQQQQQQQQRSDASRKASVVVGGDRGDEYEYEEDFGVVQDAGGSEVQASDRRLSRSVGPQSRQSLSVSQQAQQQQQQQQRSDASRKASVVVGGGRGDEYEYEEDFGVVQDAGGSEVQASDRRLSRSVGWQASSSLHESKGAVSNEYGARIGQAMRKLFVGTRKLIETHPGVGDVHYQNPDAKVERDEVCSRYKSKSIEPKQRVSRVNDQDEMHKSQEDVEDAEIDSYEQLLYVETARPRNVRTRQLRQHEQVQQRDTEQVSPEHNSFGVANYLDSKNDDHAHERTSHEPSRLACTPNVVSENENQSRSTRRRTETTEKGNGHLGDDGLGELRPSRRLISHDAESALPRSPSDGHHAGSISEKQMTAAMFAEGISSFTGERVQSEGPRRRDKRPSSTRAREAGVAGLMHEAVNDKKRDDFGYDNTQDTDVNPRSRRKQSMRPRGSMPAYEAASVHQSRERGNLHTLEEVEEVEADEEEPIQVSRHVSGDRSQQQRLHALLKTSAAGERNVHEVDAPTDKVGHQSDAMATVYAEGISSYADDFHDQRATHRSSRYVSATTTKTRQHELHDRQTVGDFRWDSDSGNSHAKHHGGEEYQSTSGLIQRGDRPSRTREPTNQKRSDSGQQDPPTHGRSGTESAATLFAEGVASFAADIETTHQRRSIPHEESRRSTRRGANTVAEEVDQKLDRRLEEKERHASHSRRLQRCQGHTPYPEHSQQRSMPASTSENLNARHYANEGAHRSRRTEGHETRRPVQMSTRYESSSHVVETVESSSRSKSRSSNQIEDSTERDSTRPPKQNAPGVDVRIHPSRYGGLLGTAKESATRHAHASNQVETHDTASHKLHRLPPAPHPTMSGAAGHDYQKFRAASTHGGIVWPPGMEDEAKRVPMYHGKEKHPLVPPGMEHLVSDKQLVEYWTWLHWYSCWQLYYLQASSSHKKKRASKTASDGHTRKSDATKRGVTANWYVSLSDDKLK